MDPATTILATGGFVNTLLEKVGKFFHSFREYGTNFYTDTSLPKVTKLARVEPITVVSKDLLNNPEIGSVLNSLLSIFTGYYLQAVDILTKVNDVEVIKTLDRLNPDRDETGFLLQSANSKESYQFISQEGYQYRLPTHSRPALEARVFKNDITEVNLKIDDHSKNTAQGGHVTINQGDKGPKNIDDKLAQDLGDVNLQDLVNLSVGKLINVKIAYTKDEQERFVTIPVTVRLLVSSVPNDTIARIMTYRNQDLSLIERIHTARSGRIEFIRDLMFCQDLIDEYKRASVQDPANILSEITRRANNAKKYGLLTKNPSLVAASSLFVISDTVARDIESKLGGKLDNPRIRDKAFENTYSMIIAVVSTEWETVTFYTRGIARGATFGFKELHGKTKGNGPDIGDILKAISAGQPPSF